MRLFLLALFIIAAPAQAQSPWASDGPYPVETRLESWSDAERGRDIPVKLYLPQGEGPFPLVIFSHGLGGTREAAPYLGERWASWGLIGVFIQHPGSDAAVWAGAANRQEAIQRLRGGLRNPQVTIARYSDIPFVIDEFEERSGAWNGDPGRIGLSGHSFGAGTTLAALGRNFPQAGGPRFLDERLDAGIMLSPPAPNARIPEARHGELYSAVSRPILHLTGTEDDSPLQENFDPAGRKIPFQQIDGARQYLIVFEGGDHSVFSGRAQRRRQPDWYPEVQAITAETSTAFWLAWLGEDAPARAFIDGDGFLEAVRAGDRVERR